VISLIPAEIRRQIGRKGAFYGAMIWILLFGLGVFGWVILANDPNGFDAVESGAGLLVFAVALASIVLGATAGAYDVDQGTMRYLVMTGRPRWQLVGVRIPALLVTIVLISLPAILVILLASVIAPAPHPQGSDYFDLFYMPWMTGLLYGLLSLTIGTFLKSNGVAIAVAVVLNFAGALIAGAIQEFVSEALGNAFYPIAAGVVISHEKGAGPPPTFDLVPSTIIVIAWLVVLLGAAFLRVQRAEY
jgi:ABC-type transport system involved in multi-copper enzyme maturation permease subunit